MSSGIQTATIDGTYRTDAPFRGPNLRVTISREPGMTPAGRLKVPFRFQAPPIDSFGRPWQFDWTTTSTIAAGELPRVGGRLLERPSFQTMFLDQPHDWMVWTGSFDVQRMLSELKQLLRDGVPFRLVIGQPALWGARPLMNIVAAFTSLTPEQRGGEIGTEYAAIEFIEVPVQKLGQKRRDRPSKSATERRHTLVKGDTLYGIALDVYHVKSRWHLIEKANGITKVRPDSADDLAKWAKVHNRSSLRIPGVEAISESPQRDYFYSDDSPVGIGRTITLGT